MENSQPILDVLDKILSRNLGWISSADAKITPILAIDTAMLGVLAAMIPVAEAWLTIPAILTTISASLLLLSIGFLIAANFPRLKGPKGSLIFFGEIAQYEREEYVKKVIAPISEELLSDFARQCHRNAEIARTKFSFIKCATIFLYCSIPFFVVAIGFLYSLKSMPLKP